MRLKNETYEYIKQAVADMFVTYDIKGIPINAFEVAIIRHEQNGLKRPFLSQDPAPEVPQGQICSVFRLTQQRLPLCSRFLHFF